ncbi:MAG: zf-HC2 domain-containing protein [bacterium]|nr:zf-HC2 domain-containing protein [bacterium]
MLYRLLEDRLPADDAGSIREHLERCPSCANRARRIAALDESVMDAEQERPSPRLRPRLVAAYRAHLAARATPRRAWWIRVGRLRRAAAIALVAFASSGLTWSLVREKSGHSPPQPEDPPAHRSLDRVFPLLLDDPYTVTHADGRREIGSRIRIIQ